jgi:hypothetical protein
MFLLIAGDTYNYHWGLEGLCGSDVHIYVYIDLI